MLIELIITIAIALLLLSVIFEMYLANVRTYRFQNALYQLQANAKTAIDILTTAIHRAGYIGCAPLTADFPVAPYLSYSLTPHNKIHSTEANELVIRHMSVANAVLVEPINSTGSLSVSHHVRFAPGDILMISDCKQADIFQVKEVKRVRGRQIIYPVHPLQYQYDQQAEVGQLHITTYFIAKTRRKNRDGTPIYSLFVKDQQKRAAELVENVKKMTIRYAINQDANTRGRTIIEVTQDKIDDWSKVVGVAIDLTLTSLPLEKDWHLYATVFGQHA
jgi:Tfp pilus assembly protein PilW